MKPTTTTSWRAAASSSRSCAGQATTSQWRCVGEPSRPVHLTLCSSPCAPFPRMLRCRGMRLARFTQYAQATTRPSAPGGTMRRTRVCLCALDHACARFAPTSSSKLALASASPPCAVALTLASLLARSCPQTNQRWVSPRPRVCWPLPCRTMRCTPACRSMPAMLWQPLPMASSRLPREGLRSPRLLRGSSPVRSLSSLRRTRSERAARPCGVPRQRQWRCSRS
mmetsp:Transcript_11454/g.33988  ORF Transcript_11454/g.33988 Transcript_11454/m.33988 type:complete len:225 (-) Transcript_11454:545-1219(-)